MGRRVNIPSWLPESLADALYSYCMVQAGHISKANFSLFSLKTLNILSLWLKSPTMERFTEPRLLPDLPSFLLGRNTHGIIDWIRWSLVRWSLDGEDLRRKCTRRILPAVWDLLETRIREHPNEAREVDQYGCLPIHRVFHRPLDQEQSNAAPVSLVELLIQLHIEGLHVQDNSGSVPLHYALYHPHMRTWTAFMQSFATAM
jgi:hypothetical protein